MSKATKFRFWSENDRIFVNGDYFKNTRPIMYDWGETGIWTLNNECYVVEQYTGLKDENGKEIYEGDIIKGRWYRAKHARFNVLGEVMFAGGAFKVKDSPDGEDRDGVFLYSCYDIEVIGNIHKKPELLGGKDATGTEEEKFK